MPEAINALLIEDSPIHARLIQSLLDDVDGQRFEVDIADRMESGLQRLRQGGVDIVLLDLVLPDSQELASYFRVRAEATDLPVVILTGIDDVTLAARAVEAGAQNFMVKTKSTPCPWVVPSTTPWR